MAEPIPGGDARAVATRPRLLALGASNLARGILPLLDAQRTAVEGPIEAIAALGHGRSYGIESSLFGRRLTGIDGCGLWESLAALPPAPTMALLMDVGNDILYGVSTTQILDWVDRALHRLANADRRIVTGLPLATIRTLGPRRFVFVRSILWPACRLSLPRVLELAERIHAGLGDLAQRHAAEFCELPATWYGFDPVHVRRRHWPHAARTILGVPMAQHLPSAPLASLDGPLARLRLLGTAPAERRWFAWTQRRAQPARRWACGTTLSLW
jgi:hypothetical protein